MSTDDDLKKSTINSELANDTGIINTDGPIDNVEAMSEQHPADLAEKMEGLSLDEQISFIATLQDEDAAEAIAELDEHTRVELLESMPQERAASIVSEMSPDDAADILDELEEEHRDELLNCLESEDAEEIRQLMSFDPETAGGIMNTEIVILDENITVDAAIAQLRQEVEDKEIPYYAYIVNKTGRLVGVVSMRSLLLSRPGTLISDIAKGRNIISVTFDQERAEVARLIAHYNILAIPVIDYQRNLLGAITHDDVVDIIHDLASEDMLGMVGAGLDEDIDTPWLKSVAMRLPWLIVNMFNSAMAAFVVYIFEGSIAQMAVLAVLMPMVANQAGNTGQQALAVIIRQLATEKLERSRAINAVKREAKISVVNGLILGAFVWCAIFFLTESPMLALVMILALMLDMLLGATAGASIPLILKRLGRDPAQASSIFLTTLTDGAGFFMFLGLATLFLL